MRLVIFSAIAALLSAAFAAKDLLMVDSLLTFESLEGDIATALGFTYDVVTLSQWNNLHTKDFSTYRAIIISDPGPGLDVGDLLFLEQTTKVWGPAITGNIIIHGTDSSNHGKNDLISNSMKFAAAGQSTSGSHLTGLYLSLSQYYDYDDFATVDCLSYFGNFTVRGNLDCYNDAHIVATAPAISNLTDTYLSNWDCSVHEAFSSYPTTGKNGFQALAIADGVTGVGTQNFANSHYGLPYIISRGATPNGCGDGHWDSGLGEECDDGNTNDGDGCSRSCKCESGLPKGDGTCYPGSESLGLVRIPGGFHDVYHFSGVYSSVLITVLFKTLWGIVLASTKMIEPFYQLHKDGGASAEESLFSDYLASALSFESVKNVFRKHWVMTLTLGVYIGATISMLVASEIMKVVSANECTTPNDPLRCDLQWTIDVGVARVLQGFMGLSAFMILLRAILGRRHASGISSYPCTIAWLAALLNASSITTTSLSHIDPDSKTEVVKEAFADKQYALRHSQQPSGNFGYGIVQVEAPAKSQLSQQLGSVLSTLRKIASFLAQPISEKSHPTAKPESKPESKPEPKRRCRNFWPNIILGAFLAIHLALLGIFLYYRLSNTNSTLFMQKKRLGSRMILVVVSIILGFYWSRLEAEVRIMTPWRRLAGKNTKSRHIINMYLHGVPITTFWRALWNGNFFHALVAATAILSDFLTVAIVGIPYNFGVIQNVSFFSSNVCLGILGIMIITGLSMFWWRFTNPDMPRKPDTVAKMALMLCASKMLQHFDGLSVDMAEHKHLVERIEGRQYKLGKQMGTDGKERMMVEVLEVTDTSSAIASSTAVHDIEAVQRRT